MVTKKIISIWIVLLFAIGIFHAGTMLAQSKPAAKPPSRIDLNKATAEQLSHGKGLNVALAKAIVEFREKAGLFKAPEDLLKVRGITKEVLGKINPKVDKDMLYIAPAPSDDEDEEEPSLKPSKC
jgi:competence protein ComEA